MMVNIIISDDDSLSVNLDGDGLILGGMGDDILVSLDGNDTIDGQEGNDIISGGSGNDSLIGGLGDDTLTGGGLGFKDGQIFVTADTSGIDTLTGGEGSDLFVLGGQPFPGFSSSSDSIVHYDEAGNEDYALITDFNPSEDIIMLGGSRNDYSLINLTSRTELYFGDELIAIIEGNTELNLDSSYFQF